MPFSTLASDSVHFYNNSGGTTTWPGEYMSGGYENDGKYEYYYEYIYDPDDPDSFLPTKYIINNRKDWQETFTPDPTIQTGYTYVGTGGNNTSGTQYPSVSLESSDSPAQNFVVQNSKLYLGNFLARISNDPTGQPHTDSNTNGKNNDNPADYNDTDASKGHMSPSITGGNNDNSRYDDFYWQANIAQRPTDGSNSQRPNASVQGLVDSQLNAAGKITQGGTPLPYFDKDWTYADTYMKYWESTDASPISFPFYEVLTPANSLGTQYQAGTNASNGQYTEQARYYEFNSADANLRFDYDNRRFIL